MTADATKSGRTPTKDKAWAVHLSLRAQQRNLLRSHSLTSYKAFHRKKSLPIALLIIQANHKFSVSHFAVFFRITGYREIGERWK